MKGGYSDRPCQVLYRRSDPLDWIVGGFITNVVVPEGGYMRALGLVHLLFYYPIFYRLHSNRESSGIEAAWTDELEYKINIDIRLALIAIHSLLSPRATLHGYYDAMPSPRPRALHSSSSCCTSPASFRWSGWNANHRRSRRYLFLYRRVLGWTQVRHLWRASILLKQRL